MFFSELKIQQNDPFLSIIKMPDQRVVTYPDFSYEISSYQYDILVNILEHSIDTKIKDFNVKKVIQTILDRLKKQIEIFKTTGYKVYGKQVVSKDQIVSVVKTISKLEVKLFLFSSRTFPLFFDIDYSNNIIWLNVYWFEKNGGFVTINSNQILSCIIYTLYLLKKQTLFFMDPELELLSEMLYTMLLNTIGRKEHLSTADKDTKGLFFITLAAGLYAKFSRDKSNLKQFITRVAIKHGLDINLFFRKLSSGGVKLLDKNNIFSFDNFNTYSKIFSILRDMDVITSNDIKLSVTIISYLKFYGFMSLFDISFMVGYIVASIFPNGTFTSIYKRYNFDVYKKVVDFGIKKLVREKF